MTVTVLDRALVAGDAGRVTGERPERPDPEVPERARRRSFTAQYKLDVVAEYDAAATGEKGAVLRREGLYSSHVIERRRARDAGTLGGPARAGVPGGLGQGPAVVIVEFGEHPVHHVAAGQAGLPAGETRRDPFL